MGRVSARRSWRFIDDRRSLVCVVVVLVALDFGFEQRRRLLEPRVLMWRQISVSLRRPVLWTADRVLRGQDLGQLGWIVPHFDRVLDESCSLRKPFFLVVWVSELRSKVCLTLNNETETYTFWLASCWVFSLLSSKFWSWTLELLFLSFVMLWSSDTFDINLLATSLCALWATSKVNYFLCNIIDCTLLNKIWNIWMSVAHAKISLIV